MGQRRGKERGDRAGGGEGIGRVLEGRDEKVGVAHPRRRDLVIRVSLRLSCLVLPGHARNLTPLL